MIDPYSSLNPRFCAYAHSLGSNGPALQAKGFAPHEFMAFIRRELFAYCDSIGRTSYRLGDLTDHAAFTGWLLERYPEVTA